MNLEEIGLKYKTGKFVEHTYAPVYELLLGPLRDRPIRLLEVGTMKEGPSLQMWLEYFPYAFVYGIDTGPVELVHERLETFVFDQADPVLKIFFRPNFFDVIIDDAGHVSSAQKTCYHNLWGSLKPGGLYFVEDLQDVRDLYDWAHQPLEYIHCGFRSFHSGEYRPDDVMVVIRKPGG